MPKAIRGGLLVLAVLAGTVLVSASIGSSASSGVTYFGTQSPPDSPAVSQDDAAVELGMRVRFATTGRVIGVRFFKASASDEGSHTGSVWSASGEKLRTATFTHESDGGWQEARLDNPLPVTSGEELVVSYFSPTGRYTASADFFTAPASRGSLSTPVSAGVYRYGTSSGYPTNVYRASNYWVDVVFLPELSTSEPVAPELSTSERVTPEPSTALPTAGFPNASSTGVPRGTELSPYLGSCTITASGTQIRAKQVACTLVIRAENVLIEASRVDGAVLTEGGSVTIQDSVISAGDWVGPAIGYADVHVRTTEIRGGQHSVLCTQRCVIEDSWLHDQSLPADAAHHNNGFLSNGATDVTLRSNRIACTPASNSVGGGCSGNVSLFGDFAPNADITIEGNLFMANPSSISYCLYAGHDPGKAHGSEPARVLVTNNVFERGPNNRCGMYGPVTSFVNANDNVWSSNHWDDGTPISP